MSTVGSMDPVEGGKCTTAMEKQTLEDGCTVCVCNGATWDCNGDACSAGCVEGGTKLADDGCNSCTCNGAGEWVCGADKDCSGGMACKPGDTSVAADGCNACTCDDQGSWDCTADAKCSPSAECQPGDTKLRDDGCYRCGCDASGQWACPDTACPQCVPGEMSSNDCLSCVCNPDGDGWTCTGPADGNCAPQPCTPGAVTDAGDGCNTCTCGADGVLRCTMIDCPPSCPPPRMLTPMEARVCMPGPVFAQDPAQGTCCAYDLDCYAPEGWPTFASSADCKGGGLVCDAGTADCDGDPGNGCETDVANSPENCGGCGFVCMSLPDQMAVCQAGQCVSPEPAGTCLYAGIEYAPGQSFSSRDGCNTCGCLAAAEGPTIACTEKACACDAGREPYREYAGSSPDACKAVDFACPDATIPFTNECGCGCEQSVECPDRFDCTPSGAMNGTCDPDLLARCPFSSVAK